MVRLEEKSMIPQEITYHHVLHALADIDRDGVPDRRHSRDYDLIHEGRRYPPKYVISLANRWANGEELDAGRFIATEAHAFLERLGFTVRRRDAGRAE